MKIHMPMQKTPVTKEAKGKKFARKAGKTAKAAGKALGVLFAGTGIITSLAVKAQDNAKAPAGKHVEITVASARSTLPASTLVMHDGIDTLTHHCASVNAKKIRLKPNPNQAWCDGIELTDGKLTYKNVIVNGTHYNSSDNLGEFFEIFQLAGATTENIKWQKAAVIDNTKIAYIVIESKDNSVLAAIHPEFETGQKTWIKAIFAFDDTRIFANDNAIGITSDGAVVAATPTSILIIQPGREGDVKCWTLEAIAGTKVPQMVAPELTCQGDFVVIKDQTITDGKGNKYKIILDARNMKAAIVEIDADPVHSML